jgi:uncharacterized glyoxalase superfamily protein PhnB
MFRRSAKNENLTLRFSRVVKEPQETFWGGFSGYFADVDGYYCEVAWGPMFEFTDNGALRFKDKP